MGIEARIGAKLHSQQVRYGVEPPIQLHFFEVIEFNGEPQNLEFEKIAWERRENLPTYDFLEGDVEFVSRLAADR